MPGLGQLSSGMGILPEQGLCGILLECLCQAGVVTEAGICILKVCHCALCPG